MLNYLINQLMFNRFTLCLLALATFASCDPQKIFNQVEKVDLGPFQSTMVPNIFINNVNPAALGISATVPVVGSNAAISFVEDAVAKLYENGVLKASFSKSAVPYDYAYYATNTIATPGNVYQLVVTHPSYPTCTSYDTMPSLVPISIVKTGNVRYVTTELGGTGSGSNKFTDTLTEVRITFTDALGEDFYRLIIADTSAGLAYGGAWYSSFDLVGPISSDPVFKDALQFNPFGVSTESRIETGRAFFTDATFNGQQKSISVFLSIADLSATFGTGSYTARLKKFIALQHLSRATFLRNISEQKLQENGNPFAQPALLYTNTTGGYGILGCCSSAIDSVQLN
jgi:hypothetical protein